MELDANLHVRMSTDLYLAVKKQWRENLSEVVREMLINRLQEENSEEFFNKRIQEHKEAIEELMKKKQKPKKPPVKKDKINDIIDKAKHNFNKFKRYDIPNEYNIKWLNNHVIPDLKKNGWDGSVNDLLDEVSKG